MRTATLRRSATTAAAVVLAVGLLGQPATPTTTTASPTTDARFTTVARDVPPNPVTPGRFHGYGFDQCLTPSQSAMDAWLRRSPFMAVGIYISGDSRACRNQPNLTPRWVRTQLANGWRLLPITLGPQASCQPRFPRYDDDFKIDPSPGRGNDYTKARKMGRTNAAQSVADAKALGIVPGSTLWYDLEGFDPNNTHCRESALAFLSGWVAGVRKQRYVSGVYSSAGSGGIELDQARMAKRKDLNLPDRIWVARWDGVANTSTSYLREDGWRPGNRIKQYRGGHDEVWGGVRINIDSNRLELGTPRPPAENHCGHTAISFGGYRPLNPPSTRNGPVDAQVKALKCLLSERGVYAGKVNASYTRPLLQAVRAWHSHFGFPSRDRWGRRDWMSLLSYGSRPVLKFGTGTYFVRRIQRALNAADIGVELKATGLFGSSTSAAVRTYQKRTGLPQTGVVTGKVWKRLRQGKR